MVVENGGYTLKDTFDDTTILGWMIRRKIPNTACHSRKLQANC